jgi:hypothetical protein
VLRSTRPSLVLERCQDARRERGWAAALDQLDQRVQIDAVLAREVLGEFSVEAGLSQSCATPGDDVGRCSSRPGPFSGSKVHVSLARPREPFLPSPIAYLAPTRMWSICHEPEDAEKANRGGRLRRPGCAGTRPRPPAEL